MLSSRSQGGAGKNDATVNQWAACAALSSSARFIDSAFAQSCVRSRLPWVDARPVSRGRRRARPGKAPLAVGFRQTENAINVAPGKGVWKSVTALGKVQRRYLDPVSGQAGYYGTVMEGGETAIVTVRVRVENRKLTEAEWYIARANDPGMTARASPAGRPPTSTIPNTSSRTAAATRRAAQRARRSRDAEPIADSYFDAITSHDGSIALAHRVRPRENGTPAPGGAFLPPAPPRAGPPAAQPPAAARAQVGSRGSRAGSSDCVAGLPNFNLAMVAARRIPLIDEEAQVVLAMGVFIRRPGSPTPRNASASGS